MRVTRFIDSSGKERLGQNFNQGQAEMLEGNLFGKLTATGQLCEVKKILAPLTPSNIFAIGLNYKDHTAESGLEQPRYPTVFMKNTASVIANGDDIVIPPDCIDPPQIDYEGELAVVIGKAAKNIPEQEALEYVRGYTVANDVSARRWQKHAGAGQWIKGKSFDTFCPLGPELITADEIANPQGLTLETRVNGRVMQHAGTDQMIFSVAQIIAYLSSSTTLLPGTLILTGTPAGVGFARQPPVWLMPGDEVAVSISKLGVLCNPVTEALNNESA